MIQSSQSKDRGHANHGWLDTYHTFSFASYQDPSTRGFRSLRIMNEDFVEAAGQGFGTHPHHDMEIVTYVLSRCLGAQRLDGKWRGPAARLSSSECRAGKGVTHSEFNPSSDEPVHLYQIWLLPERRGIDPSYDQKSFAEEERHNRLRLVASRDAADGSLLIRQDARILPVESRRGSQCQSRR